jgi:hypothetical protein
VVQKSSVDNAFAIEGAKMASIFCVATATATSAPLLIPVAGLGVALYSSAVALDTFLTGRLCLFPLTRITVGQIFLLAAGRGGSANQLSWDEEYQSRQGLDESVPAFRLEPPTIDVPVVRPVHRLPQQMAPELDPLEPPIAQAVATVERRAVERQVSKVLGTPPVSAPKVRDRAWLLEELKRDCPEFIRLLKAPPIRCVGQQRTGKTTLVKLLCLCRTIILPNHQVIAATPHYKEGEGYPACFRIAGIKGTARDPAAIAKEWAAMARRIYQCGTPGHSFTNIWDEFGLYAAYVEGSDLLEVITSSLRETAKFGEYPIFIAHGETAAFLPGVTGLVGPFLASTTRVETIGAPTEDAEGLPETKPTGQFKIKWTDGSRSNGEIPGWLTEELLLSIIDGQQSTQVRATVSTLDSTPSLDHWVTTPNPEGDIWESADASPTPARSPVALPRVPING